MKNKFSIALSLAVVFAMLVTSLALADEIVNNVDNTIDSGPEQRTITAGGSTTVGFYINATSGGGDLSGCNVDTDHPATVTFNVANVTANPSSIQFTSCGETGKKDVVFSASVVGTSLVKPDAPTGGKDGSKWDRETAKFNLVVESASPSDSTPPNTIIDTGPAALTNSAGATFTLHATEAGSTFACSLDGGAFTSCASPASYSGLADGGHTFAVAATDAASNTDPTPATYNWTVDTTPPTVTASPDRAADHNGWYNHAVTISFSSLDADVVDCDDPVIYSGPDDDSASVSGTCTDAAGNVGTGTFDFVYDATAPVLSLAFTPDSPDGNNGWWKTAGGVPFAWTCSDAGSGIDNSFNDGCPSPMSGTVAAQGTTNFADQVKDVAGNLSVAVNRDLMLDNVAPSITASATKADTTAYTADTWTNQDVTVHYACTDAGSDVASMTDDEVFNTEGVIASTSGDCWDNAGNSASASFGPIKIDKTAPKIVASISPADPAYTGWYNTSTGAPTVSFTCGDTGGSGLASACPASVTLSDGAAQTVSGGPISDVAGNSSNVASILNINVDLTAPALNIVGAASGPSDVCSIPSRPTFAPSDNLSGLDGTQGDSWTTPGAPSGVGTYTYNAHATDLAGNATSETRTYTVTYGAAFGGYRQPINTDGSSRFKLGSTIPLKFQLMCNGTPISAAIARLYVVKGDSMPDPGTDEAISTSAATTGNLFRYDSTGQQYIFNLSTKTGYLNPGSSTPTSFSEGTWTLKILLDDGTWHSVNIQIKK